jgi:hypothetical protein
LSRLSRTEPKHFAAEEKVAIPRRHLLAKVPVPELGESLACGQRCPSAGIKELFENGAAAFRVEERGSHQPDERQKGLPGE